jgi:hypothetical protein
MSHTAKVSAYYKDMDNKLHHITSVIGIEPEGVTENDVTLFRTTVYGHLTAIKVKEPLMVVIKGGKTDVKEAA